MDKQLLNPFHRWIKWRINKNKNVILVLNGATGSGKTYAGIRLAEDIAKMFDVPFSIKGNVDFKFNKLLEKMMRPENKKAGTPFLFEEVGAAGGGAASREWQSKTNKFFFSFMQTSRHRNQILIMTCPHFNYLDKGARNLVHVQMTTKGINFQRKICHLKPYVLQVNPNSGKIYFKYLRYRIDGQRYKLSKLDVTLPSPHIIKEYEKMKMKFTTELNELIMKGGEEKKPKPKSTINMETLTKQFKVGLSNEEIAKVWNVTVRTIQRHKKRFKEAIPAL